VPWKESLPQLFLYAGSLLLTVLDNTPVEALYHQRLPSVHQILLCHAQDWKHSHRACQIPKAAGEIASHAALLLFET
jgi:hypothetical protein